MSGNSRLPSGEQGVREYRSVCTWASQKSGRIVEDAAVEVRSQLHVVGPKQKVRLSSGQIVGVLAAVDVGNQVPDVAAPESVNAIFDAGTLLPELLEVNSMTRECFWGPDLDRGPLLADTGWALR